jgi:hypothetical protein
MTLLVFLTFVAKASLTVNVQAVLDSSQQTLRVKYLSPDPLRLEVSQQSEQKVLELAASAQMKMLEFKLSANKIESVRALRGEELLEFPQFFFAAPVTQASSPEHNTIGKAQGGVWVIKAGDYHIEKPLMIEADKIMIQAGSTFTFSSGSSLTFKGETHLQGQSSAPIKFHGKTPETDFFVQLIQNPSSSSTLTHVSLKHAKRDLAALPTGVLTLYGGTFNIDDLSLSHIQAEDALNGVKATINLQHLTISDVTSDGFDCDFCQLTIREALIERCEGDGLDVSGSELEAEKINISAAQDKAFSIGEGSLAKLQNITISKSDIGLAIKDGSKALVSQYQIQSTRLPFTLYTLKPWFPASPELTIDPAITDRRQIELKNGARLLEPTP